MADDTSKTVVLLESIMATVQKDIPELRGELKSGLAECRKGIEHLAKAVDSHTESLFGAGKRNFNTQLALMEQRLNSLSSERAETRKASRDFKTGLFIAIASAIASGGIGLVQILR